MDNLKNSRMISVHFQGKPFNITVIQLYAPTTGVEPAEVDNLWRPTTPSRTHIHTHTHTHTHTNVLCLNSRLECKSRKSISTQNNRHVWAWSEKWSRVNITKVLSREYTSHRKHPFTTNQEMTLHIDITRWPMPELDWLCSLNPKMETSYTVTKNKTWN